VQRRTPTFNTMTTDDAVRKHASTESRVVISHDYRTMRARAEDRLRAGLPMAGLLLVPQDMPVGRSLRSWS
jgi:uncharacterized protein (DUF2235 family)